jgi:FkbM family methyltransferase
MSDEIDYEYLYNKGGGFFERVIKVAYQAVVGKGDLVVDGGAHIGDHTGPLAQCVGRTGKVLAIEPLPHLAEDLREKFPSDKYPQVDVIACAVGSESGQSRFNWVTNNEGFSGIRPRNYPAGVEIAMIEVTVKTIDEILKPIEKRLSFIKLDLEGGEFSALLGAKQSIRRYNPVIAFENGLEWTRRYWDYTMDDFFRFFDEIDYDLYELFLRRLTPNEWTNPNKWPWEFVAMKKGDPIQQPVKTAIRNFLLKELAGQQRLA